MSGHKNEKQRGAATIVIVAAVAIVVLLGAYILLFSGKEKSGANSVVIDDSGGEYDLGKIHLAVPAGAVTESVEITARPVDERVDEASLPHPLPFNVVGGVTFEPSGLSFEKPITVTLPLANDQGSKTPLSLFLYEQDERQFTDTGTDAKRSDDTSKATVQVRHFSKYILVEGWKRVKEQLSHPELSAKEIQRTEQRVRFLKTLYDVGVGQETAFDGQCYRLVGAGYNLNIQSDNPKDKKLMEAYYKSSSTTVGRISNHPQNISVIMNSNGDVTRITGRTQGGVEHLKSVQGSYGLTIDISYEPCNGRFEVSGFEITPQEARPGDQVGIFVQVTNTGDQQGKRFIALRVGNAVEWSDEIMLDAGAYTDLLFNTSREDEGTYAVSVEIPEDPTSDSFVVTKEKTPENEPARSAPEGQTDLNPAPPPPDQPDIPPLPEVEVGNPE